MKYKVGDKVRVHTKEWFEKNCSWNIVDSYSFNRDSNSFVSDMIKFCEQEVTIEHIDKDSYIISEDDGLWYWEDWMFEDKVEENKEVIGERVGNADIIRDLCDYLDISVGQVIISKCTGYKYRLSEEYILEVYENDTWKICGSFTFIEFIRMLKERRFVTKWIPKVGETVYYMSLGNSSLWDYCTYNDTEHDKMMVSKGLYFRTQREAMECAKKFLEQYKEDN